jgi:hypothetical protein
VHDEVQTLGKLNVRIGQAENDGDRGLTSRAPAVDAMTCLVSGV